MSSVPFLRVPVFYAILNTANTILLPHTASYTADSHDWLSTPIGWSETQISIVVEPTFRRF